MRTLRATVMFAACAAFVAITVPALDASAQTGTTQEAATSAVSSAGATDPDALETEASALPEKGDDASVHLPKVQIMAALHPEDRSASDPTGTSGDLDEVSHPATEPEAHEAADQGLDAAVVIPDDLTLDISDVPGGKDALLCLAMNDYFEARGEDLPGRVAVAKVVLNRTVDARFPDSVCGVVFERRRVSADGAVVCQFSWHCDGQSDVPANGTVWRESLLIAAAVLFGGDSIEDPGHGALWYHATSVTPPWSPHLQQVAEIGRHIFYQDRQTTPADDQQVASLPSVVTGGPTGGKVEQVSLTTTTSTSEE